MPNRPWIGHNGAVKRTRLSIQVELTAGTVRPSDRGGPDRRHGSKTHLLVSSQATHALPVDDAPEPIETLTLPGRRDQHGPSRRVIPVVSVSSVAGLLADNISSLHGSR